MTWGRERGPVTDFETLYPDFTAMQDRLDAGYRAMANAINRLGVEVRIAPVGTAFRLVHAEAAEGGADPTAEGSIFDALYDADGSHPSAEGSYLAAWVIFGTITAVDPMAVDDNNAFAMAPNGIDPARARRLRRMASMALTASGWMPSP